MEKSPSKGRDVIVSLAVSVGAGLLLFVICRLSVPLVDPVTLTILALVTTVAGFFIIMRYRAFRRQWAKWEVFSELHPLLPGFLYETHAIPGGNIRLNYVSEGCRALLGRTSRELVENPHIFTELIHPEDAPEILRKYGEHYQTLEPWNEEYRLLVPGRDVVWISGHANLERLDDGTVVWRGFITDITRRRETEESLRVNDQLLRATFDRSSVGMAIRTVDLRMVHANEAYCRILGYTEEEMKAMSVEDIIVPEDYQSIMATMSDLASGRSDSAQMEMRGRCKDGSIIWLAVHSVTVLNPGGTSHVVSQITDITSRKEMEESLRKSEETFRTLFESSPTGMLIRDSERHLLHINKAFCDLLGYSEEEMHSRDVLDITHPEDYEAERPLIDALNRQLMPSYSIEKRYIHKDGREVWVLVSISGVPSPSGKLAYYIAQAVNITPLKSVEADLRKSEDRLAIATKARHIGIWEVERATGTVTWNDVMYGIFGVDRDFKPTMESHFDFLHPGDRRKMREKFRSHLDSKDADFEMEARLVTAGESIKTVRVHASVIRGQDGHTRRIVGTTIDISKEREAAEELARAKEFAEAAARAKGRFLAMMSHEIRTPMNGVIGYTSLLKSTPLNHAQQDYLKAIEAGGENLLRLIDDILDLSKVESGRIRIEPTVFDIRQCVLEISDLLSTRARDKRIVLQCEVAAGAPRWIEIDRLRLLQILTNIVGNAIKFTDRGSVRLRVEAHRLGETEWMWQFIIIDTGPGIAPEDQAQIFEPFVQTDSSFTRRHGGTGLGLSISRNLARLLGGVITLESKPGVGSSFVISIPAPAPEEYSREIKAEPALTKDHLRGKRVLIVEDTPSNRKLCVHFIKHIGCDFDCAEDGRIAVEKFRGGTFDAILMDMQLPELDGCEATREIRIMEQADGRTPTPVIAMTANAMSEDRRECLLAGMDDFLSKPVKLESLAQMLARWIPANDVARPARTPLPDGESQADAVSS